VASFCENDNELLDSIIGGFSLRAPSWS